jgi:hypothetical protein
MRDQVPGELRFLQRMNGPQFAKNSANPGGQPSLMNTPSLSGWLASRSLAEGERRLVSLNFASWNQLDRWLRQVDGLKRVA